MSPSDSPSPRHEPTRELLLAQALDACIDAERRAPGSADEVISRQPTWARAELRQLIGLASAVDAAANQAILSDEFRVAARQRLMERIGGAAPADSTGVLLSSVPSVNGYHRPTRARTKWLSRGVGGGLLAATLVVAATLTATASALPGEPLYGIKQAREELDVRLAPNDQARALALLVQADARLDETSRLLEQGRTAEVAETAQRYDQTVERATTAYVVTIDASARGASTSETMEARLSEQQQQLQELLQSAPEPARADLREALVTTERGRALVADPRPVERALGRAASSPPVVAPVLPTMAVEQVPTEVPTATEVPPTETPVVVVAEEPAAPPAVSEAHESSDREGEGRRGEDRQVVVPPARSVGGQASRGGPPPAPARAPIVTRPRDQGGDQQARDADEHNDEPAPVVADAQPQLHGEAGAQVNGRGGPDGGGGDDRGGGGDNRGGGGGDNRGGGGGDDRGGAQPAQLGSGDNRSRSGDDGRQSSDSSTGPVTRQQAPVGTSSQDGGGTSGDRARTGDGGGGSSSGGDNTPSTSVRTTNAPVSITQTDRGGRDGRDGGGGGDNVRSVVAPNPTPTPTPSRSSSSSGASVRQAAAPTSTPSRRENGDATPKNPNPTSPPKQGDTPTRPPAGGGGGAGGGDHGGEHGGGGGD